MKNIKSIVVTGSLGFIGSQVVRQCLSRGWYVLGIDKETYAASQLSLRELRGHPNYTHLRADISRLESLPDCDYVINTAAETHVDNSISRSKVFLNSNINGVYNLLELIRSNSLRQPTFVHFSTDEVYGDIVEGAHTESHLLKPSNPYSASKASADQLVLAWGRTYNLPYVILRPTNNYGPRQYPEKLIPKSLKCIRMGRKIPLHNGGTPYRMWLHSEDTARAVMSVIDSGGRNEIYNISGDTELQNIEVVNYIVNKFNVSDGIDYSYDRKGQDVRYSVDDSKLRSLGWKPENNFWKQLDKLIETDEGYIW